MSITQEILYAKSANFEDKGHFAVDGTIVDKIYSIVSPNNLISNPGQLYINSNPIEIINFLLKTQIVYI